MKCHSCNQPMELGTNDIWICHNCEIGLPNIDAKVCQHENIVFGVDGCAICEDCHIYVTWI